MLAPEMAERFGVTVETVSAAPLASTVRATGTVLDAADGIGVVVAPVAVRCIFHPVYCRAPMCVRELWWQQ